MGVIHAKTKRWTREEYQALGETGALTPDERVELIEGEIVSMSPQGPAHAAGIRRLTRVLFEAFGATHEVSVQCPLDVSDFSQPEPDFALIRQADDPGESTLPRGADLVIEVSVTSLAYDRNEKCAVYAKAGIPEVWLVDLVARCVEVHRKPASAPNAVFGYAYASLTTFQAGQSVSPWWDESTKLEVARILGQGYSGQRRLPT